MTDLDERTLRLIAGSGRSGTTWILDVLAEANGLRPIFEPLHTDVSEIGRKFGHAYLQRDEECSALKDMLIAATNGSLHSIWTDYRIKPSALALKGTHFRSMAEFRILLNQWKQLAQCFGKYRERKARPATLVKCIRANLMLDWIAANLNARIALVMRHPGAAVESRLRFAEHWNPFPFLEKYRNDAALTNGPLCAQGEWLKRNLSRVEALAAIWCIENHVPASQARANGYIVVFYEELLEHPDMEWPRLVQGLDLAHVPTPRLLERPSQQSAVRLRKEMSSETYSASYGGWRERLTRHDLKQIESVLQAFGVDFYSVSHLRPNVKAFAVQSDAGIN